MKIKNLAYIASISVLVIGGGVLGFLEMRKKPVIPHPGRQHHLTAPDSSPSVSIPKSAVLVLLAVGIIGVLSVRRKKKTIRSAAQNKFSGDKPPEGLIEEISNIERKVRLISRALE